VCFYGYKQEELKRMQQTVLDIFDVFAAICEKYEIPYFANGGTAIGAVRHQGYIPWDDDIDVGMLREDYERFLQVAPGELAPAYEIIDGYHDENCPDYITRISKIGTKQVSKEHTKYKVDNLGISMDIFPYDYVPEDPKLRKKQVRARDWYNRLHILWCIPNPGVPGKGVKGKILKAGCFAAHYFLRLFVSGSGIGRKHKQALMRYHNKTELVTSMCDIQPEDWIVRLDEIFPLQELDFEGRKMKVMRCNHAMLTRGFGNYMEYPPVSERTNHRPEILDFGTETIHWEKTIERKSTAPDSRQREKFGA
jgi:licD family protein